MKAAILGANGYTGMVLTRLLLQHPNITEIIPASRSLMNTGIREYDPGLPVDTGKFSTVNNRYVSPDSAAEYKPDVIFSALPHLVSADLCANMIGTVPVIDLSADFRLRSDDRFLAAYGQKRPQQQLQDSAVYGLVEWYREQLKSAELIACPGCYPTATLLALLPFLAAGLAQDTIIVNAMSGITGAGKKANTRLLLAERAENMEAYLPGSSHRHWNEIGQEIEHFYPDSTGTAAPQLLFTPHLVPVKQGMLSTITFKLSADSEHNEHQLHERLTAAYSSAPLVEVLPLGVLPQTRSVRATGRCQIGLQLEGDYLMLFSAIDNLYRGASAQAVQAMNIRFGLPETAGIPLHGEV